MKQFTVEYNYQQHNSYIIPIQKAIPSIPFGIIHLVRFQTFPKSNISYPLIRTRTRAYQGVRNVGFSKKFAEVLNK